MPRGFRRLLKSVVTAAALATVMGGPAAGPARAAAEVALRVDGLACPFCAYGIEKKILGVPGVASVDILLDEGLVVTVLREGTAFDPKAFARAVDDAGFTLRRTFLRDAVGTLEPGPDGGMLLRGTDPRARFLLRFADDVAPPAVSGGQPLRVAVTGELEDASREPFALRVHEIRKLAGDAAALRGDPR